MQALFSLNAAALFCVLYSCSCCGNPVRSKQDQRFRQNKSSMICSCSSSAQSAGKRFLFIIKDLTCFCFNLLLTLRNA